MSCLSQHPNKQKKGASLVAIWKTALWEGGTAHKTVLKENVMLDIGATNEKEKVSFHNAPSPVKRNKMEDCDML